MKGQLVIEGGSGFETDGDTVIYENENGAAQLVGAQKVNGSSQLLWIGTNGAETTVNSGVQDIALLNPGDPGFGSGVPLWLDANGHLTTSNTGIVAVPAGQLVQRTVPRMISVGQDVNGHTVYALDTRRASPTPTSASRARASASTPPGS